MKATLRIKEQLSAVHKNVKVLIIDTNHTIESWQKISQSYPDVNSITIKDIGRVGGVKVLNQAFFEAFPILENLCVDVYSGESSFRDFHNSLPIDLKAVDTSLMASLQSLELEDTLSEDISILGNLPELKSLKLQPRKRLKLHAQPGSRLESFELELLKKDCVLDIDLSQAPLTLFQQKIRLCNYKRDFDISVVNLRLPTTLDSLRLELVTTTSLPEHVLANQIKLTSLWLEQTGGGISDKLFEPLRQIKECHLAFKNLNEPLPAILLNADCMLDDLTIITSDTALSGPMLPTNADLQSFTLIADNQNLSALQQLSLPQLKHLKLHLENLNEVPKWLAQCIVLTSLTIGAADISQFPILPALKRLRLYNMESGPLPATVLNHPGIFDLEVSVANNWEVGLGNLSEMQALKRIKIQSSWDNLPDFSGVENLPLLEQLTLYTYIIGIDPAWLKIPSSAVLRVLNEPFNTELNIIRAANCDSKSALDWLNTLLHLNKANELPQMPTEFHLTLMEAKYNRFKAQHKQWLRQEAQASESRTPLNRDSIVFISGRSEFKATELKAKAKELGFTITKNLDTQVTHVLIGRTPKQLDKLDLTRHALIDDTSLQQFFTAQAPKFLQQQDAKSMEGNILDMLSSPEESTHMLAIEMLYQGGVTKEMCLPLFFILKTTSNKILRKKIQHLLAGMGDDVFQLAVTDRVYFDRVRGKCQYGHYYGQGRMVARLKTQKKKWGESLCHEFATAYFNRFNEGLMYLLMQKPTTDKLLNVWQSLVDCDTLNVRRGVGFDTLMLYWDKTDPVSNYHWLPCTYANDGQKLGKYAAFELPTTLAGIDNIQRLDLGNCLLSKLPKGTDAFTHIRVLSLANNMFRSLPTSISNFTELEELDLSFNHFTEFPQILFKLTKLKRLDFRRARRPYLGDSYGPDYRSIAVPQAFVDAFPNCEILQD